MKTRRTIAGVARLDHVVLGVSDLAASRSELERSGLDFIPGGRHPSRTHNALLTSPGRWSYAELIAVTGESDQPKTGDEAVPADDPMAIGVSDQVRQGGLVAYAVAVDDIDEAVQLLASAGFPFGDVRAGSRETTDGRIVRWRSAVPEPGFGCSELPFLIEWAGRGPDRTGIPSVDGAAYVTGVDVGSTDLRRIRTLLGTLGWSAETEHDAVIAHNGEVRIRFEEGAGRLRAVHLRRSDSVEYLFTDASCSGGARRLRLAVEAAEGVV